MHIGRSITAAPTGKNMPTNWLLPAEVTNKAADANNEACRASVHVKLTLAKCRLRTFAMDVSQSKKSSRFQTERRLVLTAATKEEGRSLGSGSVTPIRADA